MIVHVIALLMKPQNLLLVKVLLVCQKNKFKKLPQKVVNHMGKKKSAEKEEREGKELQQ
jgi:hypothetical protein